MKQKQSRENRTLLTECPKLGVEQTYLGHAPNVASYIQKLTSNCLGRPAFSDPPNTFGNLGEVGATFSNLAWY